MPLAGPLIYSREELRDIYFKRKKLWLKDRTENDQEYIAQTTPLLDAIEAKQTERNPNWKKGDALLVYWKDIQEATGALAYNTM